MTGQQPLVHTQGESLQSQDKHLISCLLAQIRLTGRLSLLVFGVMGNLHTHLVTLRAHTHTHTHTHTDTHTHTRIPTHSRAALQIAAEPLSSDKHCSILSNILLFA